ncbi:hypothetical protein BS50DRAFT_101535 [Corynespora cassiicola Philippines]|uniref:Uncharacterized protein n=1 Tax=Corynespora cassiicola Philippines TaxID=1448308 RepID=A0A2T2NCJ7_CORCC|nr:hypothetical protein BS50DRAFT_101535 [Corynespora cassiicola Philippines]
MNNLPCHPPLFSLAFYSTTVSAPLSSAPRNLGTWAPGRQIAIVAASEGCTQASTDINSPWLDEDPPATTQASPAQAWQPPPQRATAVPIARCHPAHPAAPHTRSAALTNEYLCAASGLTPWQGPVGAVLLATGFGLRPCWLPSNLASS